MAKKVLFVTQEITPYVPETAMSLVGRYLPQAVQEDSHEIRTFMPRWGNINERRNQLHEVIRLSGMNLIIDDTDHLIHELRHHPGYVKAVINYEKVLTLFINNW